MALPRAWIDAEYALLHGDDSEGRKAALEAWKGKHLDPEWADFSLIVCAEGCSWPEIQNALCESAPLGVARVVIVPQAENLLEKPKDLPAPVKAFLANPISGTRLLLVSRTPLAGGPGRILSVKPFSEWEKQGRVFKVGAMESRDALTFLEDRARTMGLRLASGVTALLVARMGGDPGILTRTMEVLDLLAEDRNVTQVMVDQATFRLGEQNVFAWGQAWQSGNIAQALATLRVAMEDDPASAPLILLGQARREVERVMRLDEARKRGVKAPQALMTALGLSPKQGFLLDRCARVLDRIGPEGAARLSRVILETDLDLKGKAISQSVASLTSLTISLARAWSV